MRGGGQTHLIGKERRSERKKERKKERKVERDSVWVDEIERESVSVIDSKRERQIERERERECVFVRYCEQDETICESSKLQMPLFANWQLSGSFIKIYPHAIS